MKVKLIIVLCLNVMGCANSNSPQISNEVDSKSTKTVEERLSVIPNNIVNEACTFLSGSAESIMMLRQEDVPQEEILEFLLRQSVENNTEIDYDFIKILHMYTNDAFLLPLGNTDQAIENTIKKFKEQKYEECVQKQ